MANMLRNLPSVNELLDSAPLKGLADRVGRSVVVSGVRQFLDRTRDAVQAAAADPAAAAGSIPAVGDLAERIAHWILWEDSPPLRPVINATGVLLHTGLGRAPLADQAVAAMAEIAGGYASVEVELEEGKRSQRVQAVEKLLRELTGAEAAAVVNNNAGATMIALAALAAGREVIVSRGQLIEIGGSYRLPDVMQASGARLREVGTTNKTRIGDYAAAVGEETGALLRVHPSNFVVVGFTHSASLEELVELGRRHKVPVIDDIGSGALVDFSEFGLEGEPVARESIAAGADLVLFSGDKLLGGPQCGILVGRRELIDRVSRHPLMRALRVDKITLAALAATLQLYRDPQRARQHVPLLALLSTPLENLRNRAERLAPQMAAAAAIATAEVVEGTTFLGGGSVPTQEIPTVCIGLRPAEGNVDQLAARLRTGSPSVVGRVQQDRLLLDLRSVFPRQDIALVNAVEALAPRREETEAAASVEGEEQEAT